MIILPDENFPLRGRLGSLLQPIDKFLREREDRLMEDLMANIVRLGIGILIVALLWYLFSRR
jgi:hypothetical protein